MRLLLAILLTATVPLAASAAVSSFVFTSPGQLEMGTRQTITVQSQNNTGEKENVTQTTCLEVRTTSPSGRFFSGANSVDPLSVLVLTMSKNSANRNFYYEDNQAGSYNFGLKAAYRPEEENRTCPNWPVEEWKNLWNASQNYTVGNNAPNGLTQTQPQAQVTSSSGSGTSLPVEPQVFVNAGPDKVTVVGADVIFEGKAYGLEQKPLENARYIWNFGDGATAEGKKVSHTYRYPGEYIVVLDVASGYFAGSDRLKVTVENSKVLISSLGDGTRRFVELRNDSNHELDISGWILKEGNITFIVPERTYISGNKKLVFPSEVTLIPVGTDVSLLYPSGALADRYMPGRTVAIAPVPKKESNSVPVSTVVEKAVMSGAANTAAVMGADVIEEGWPPVYKWLLLTLALASVAIAGVFLLPRNRGKFEKKLSADDFKIIEDK